MRINVLVEVTRGAAPGERRCDLCHRRGQVLSECLVIASLWYDLCPLCLEAVRRAPEPASRAAWDRFRQGILAAAGPPTPFPEMPITGGVPHRLKEIHRENREREKTLVLAALDVTDQEERCTGCGACRRLFHCHLWREHQVVARCRACAVTLVGGEVGIDVRQGARRQWQKQGRPRSHGRGADGLL
jgi:hypothetical protein